MSSEGSRKRQKITRACDICRVNKKRCTGTLPCQTCTRSGKKCTYRLDYTRGRASSPLISPGINERSTGPKVREAPQADLSTSRAASVDPAEEIQDNSIGSASAHTWLRRAWFRLGRAKKTFLRAPQSSQATSIFAHGDANSPTTLEQNFAISRISQSSLNSILANYFDRSSATYRYLHEPTVRTWLRKLQQQPDGLVAVQIATVYAVLAHGYVYMTQEEQQTISTRERTELSADVLYSIAKRHTDNESGSPCLTSVQARLVLVHYLLSTSRPNQAWYAFGTVVQLGFALGLHRQETKGSKRSEFSQELRRRTFGIVYVFDRYISLLLGRPGLIHDETVSQELPRLINDEDMTENEAESFILTKNGGDADCLLHATIAQIELSRLVNQVVQEQYEVQTVEKLVETVSQRNQLLADWNNSLPPFLSGAVKASSLIPVLRRQATVIKLFYNHAVMMVNRPLLLQQQQPAPGRDNSQSQQPDHQTCIEACIEAAKDVARQVLRFAEEGQNFEVFWFIQNIAFQALCILYLHLLQQRPHREDSGDSDQEGLLQLTENARKALSTASMANAPTLQYSVALQELSREARQQLWRHGRAAAAAVAPHGQPTASKVQDALGSTVPLSTADTGAGQKGNIDSHPRQQEITTNTQFNLDVDNSTLTRQDSLDFDLDGVSVSDSTFLPSSSSYTYATADSNIDDDDLSRLFWPQLDAMPLLFENWLSTSEQF